MEKYEHLVSTPVGKTAFAAIDHTEITWLGAAGFLLNVRGHIVFVDPVLRLNPSDSTRCETGMRMKLPYPLDSRNIPRADDVFYTHADFDHMGHLTVDDLASKGANLWGSLCTFHKLMEYHEPYEQCPVIRPGDKEHIGDIYVEAIAADHPWQLTDMAHVDTIGKPYRYGDYLGFIFNTPDGRFLFPGDTRLMEHHLKIADIQVMALDVSICRNHLGPDGAVTLANSLSKAILIPMHYATYDEPGIPGHCDDIANILPRISRWKERVRILNLGETVRLVTGQEIK